MQVKIITNKTAKALERDINTFLEFNDFEILEIQYRVSIFNASAMVVYK